MLISKAFRLLALIGLTTIPGSFLVAHGALAQTTDNIAPAVPDSSAFPEQTDDGRPLIQDDRILSIANGQRLMEEAQTAVSNENYEVAARKLQEARQVFNQLSNLYQDLLGSFTGVDARVADTLRRQAYDTTQLRDEASYQLALVHRAQNQPDLSVPLLIQIVRSQQPTRDLGQRAYRQLYELGFVDSPYPPTGGATSTLPANP
ncbi:MULTISPECIES: hypothetical protein [unclassified Leptolyngbya]|uniref:hypothetical protein n=1 Tax=unclassified Leptolyngbya TaxID=2650499 RepID=UPI001681F85B|nr:MULTISPECIES: hypothetical protein [unclassified Leptolyngbya]MBD1914233.1 hypothetical protein [Leptolyngbya sp. FACHB-8]MBD2157240.1 hypothetical protein [Leptolyngbya sp. FACHB-16]